MKAQPVAPRVSVIVPSAEHLDLLEVCLRSLERHGPRSISFEVIVVLNFSPGPGVASLSGLDLDLSLIRSPVNLGLAGAGNRARTLARGELLVLLHDDAEIEPGWLEALVETADRHPEAGAVGGKVLFPDCGTSSILVRAETWDAAGGLEESFFPAYYVDVDLAMQVRRLGQVVLYQPASVIRHHRGASAELRFRHFVANRNRRLFVSRWADDLERQEPNEGDPADAIARAIDRAARAGQKARAGQSGVTALVQTSTPAASVSLRERKCLERHVALLRDYMADLRAAFEALGTRVEREQGALKALESAVVEEAARSAAGERSLARAHERFAAVERERASEGDWAVRGNRDDRR